MTLEELEYEEAAKLERRGISTDEARARAARLVVAMGTFADAETVGTEPLEGAFGLPDPDDEHVAAAALLSGAGAIVTSNLRDFPVRCLPISLQVLSPAEFALNTVSLDPGLAIRAVGEMAKRTGRRGEKMSVEQIIELLERRYGMKAAAEVLRSVR